MSWVKPEDCINPSTDLNVEENSDCILITPRDSLMSVESAKIFSEHYLCIYFSGVTFTLGALLFLAGSILFYPRFEIIEGINGGGAYIGSWCFELGCCMFFMGSFKEVLINCMTFHVKKNGNPTKEWLTNIESWDPFQHDEVIQSPYISQMPLSIALIYTVGSIMYIVGGVYFFPDYHTIQPSLGAVLFIAGCILFCWGALWDVIDIIKSFDRTKEKKSYNLVKITSLDSFVPLTSFIGSVLFIVGCTLYLPRFIETNFINAIHTFVAGSIFYTVSALGMIFNSKRMH